MPPLHRRLHKILDTTSCPGSRRACAGWRWLGFFLFDDNVMLLQRGNPIGERLARLCKERGMLLMMCDACALERGLAVGEMRWCTPEGQGRREPGECRVAEGVVEGVEVGCFPDLYARLGSNPPDLVLTL